MASSGSTSSERQEDRVDVRDVERARHDAVALPAEARATARARAEPLHDADARDRLLDERRRGCKLLLQQARSLRVARRVAPEPEGR